MAFKDFGDFKGYLKAKGAIDPIYNKAILDVIEEADKIFDLKPNDVCHNSLYHLGVAIDTFYKALMTETDEDLSIDDTSKDDTTGVNESFLHKLHFPKED